MYVRVYAVAAYGDLIVACIFCINVNHVFSRNVVMMLLRCVELYPEIKPLYM